MTICERMSRESVSLASLDDTDHLHSMDDRAKVRRFSQALRRGDGIPPLFVIRLNGVPTLIQGSEQAAAADRAGVHELDAIVFDALDAAESDEVGTLGFDLAESGCDVWGSLLLMGRRAALQAVA